MTLTIELLNMTPVAWLILLSPFIAFWLAGIAADLLRERFMFTRPFGITRRWFGRGSMVAVLGEPLIGPGLQDPWQVLTWEDTHGPVFVKLAALDDAHPRVLWLPATALAPLSVPVFRPRIGGRGIALTAQRPVSPGRAS